MCGVKISAQIVTISSLSEEGALETRQLNHRKILIIAIGKLRSSANRHHHDIIIFFESAFAHRRVEVNLTDSRPLDLYVPGILGQLDLYVPGNLGQLDLYVSGSLGQLGLYVLGKFLIKGRLFLDNCSYFWTTS